MAANGADRRLTTGFGSRKSGPESRTPESHFASAPLTVRQPERIRSLLTVLADLERISSRVVAEDRSGDLGGAGTHAGSRALAGAGGASARDRAIAALPSLPVMRHRLVSHLRREVRELEQRARRLARSTRRGGAYLLNELYARIRKIQAFIAEIADATAEVVRSLYIRLFIDRQELV